MPVITIYNGVFCQAEKVVRHLAATSDFRLVTDQDVVSEAVALSGMAGEKLTRAFSAGTSIFNTFSHEKERAVAWLRLAMARKLAEEGNLLFCGFASQLPPQDIGHVLRVCLIASMKERLNVAKQEEGYAEKYAQKLIRSDDEDRADWIKLLKDTNDPWQESLYDMVVPVPALGVEKSVDMIQEQLKNVAVQTSDASRAAVQDFLLAANVETALVGEGHCVHVAAKDGTVTLTVNKHVLMLERLERELKGIASNVEGVREVVTQVGKGFHQNDIYRKVDFELPSKVLLVDDEREFVETLSERPLLRDMGSAVVYDGESALDLLQDDEPEVMILDLKMPGIDGIGVLRQVKATRPEIEVIILTGHGSEDDRAVCMELGAFAYLQKPVDIDLLSQTLKAANDRIREKG